MKAPQLKFHSFRDNQSTIKIAHSLQTTIYKGI